MKAEADLTQRWLMVRRLENDLEHFGNAYGYDHRGLGWAAMAAALLDRGWISPPPAVRTAHIRRTRGLPPDRIRETLIAEANYVAAEQGVPLDVILTPSHSRTPKRYMSAADWAVRNAKVALYMRLDSLKDADGRRLASRSEIARVLGVERTSIGFYLGKADAREQNRNLPDQAGEADGGLDAQGSVDRP